MRTDVIERETMLIVVDGDGRSHRFDRCKDDGEYVVEPVDASEEIVDWVVDNTEYYLPGAEEFPLEIRFGHKLEDTVALKIIRDHGDVLPEGVDLPVSELYANWRVEEDGTLVLDSVEFDGDEYTVE